MAIMDNVKSTPNAFNAPDYANASAIATVAVTATTQATANTVYTATADCYIMLTGSLQTSGYSDNLSFLINDTIACQLFNQVLNTVAYHGMTWYPLKKGDVVKAFGNGTNQNAYYMTAPTR